MSAKIWFHSQTLWNAEGCCIREREMTQAWIPNLKEETNEEYQKWLKIKEMQNVSIHFSLWQLNDLYCQKSAMYCAVYKGMEN